MNQWIQVSPFGASGGTWESDKTFPIDQPHDRSFKSNNKVFTVQPTGYIKEDPDIQTQREAYNRRAKLKIRYINHPGKIGLLGLTTRPALVETSHSTADVSKHNHFFVLSH